MTDTWHGNGTLLAEALKKEFSPEFEVNIADVKEVSPEKIAEDAPNVIILGGAIRMFRGAPKSKRWLSKLNKILAKSGKNVKYGTGFLTHAMPTEKIQGYTRRYLNKIDKASIIESVYSQVLTARVESPKGPILPEEMDKARDYIKSFIDWIQK